MKIVRLLLALIAVVGLATFTFAADAKEVTVSGKLVCAKCTLHAEGQKECQNAIVATVDGKETTYYVSKNKVTEDFGHVCKGEKNVVATGKVTQKDGKNWLEPTKLTQAS